MPEKKPKVTPTQTYIFDEDDLAELDDLSLTSVIKDASTTIGQIEELETNDDESEAPEELDFDILKPDIGERGKG